MFPNNDCHSGCNDCPDVAITPVPLPDLHNTCTNYPSECIIYTGEDIPCLGITKNMTFAQILQIFAAASVSCNCCNIPNIDCVMSEWSEWSECTGDPLTKTRTRTIVTNPSGEGTICGPLSETTCCAVDCQYHYEWGPCDPVTLKQTGTLVIDVPRSCSGRPCPSATTITRDCCVPVNCVVTWGPWGPCVSGVRTRTGTVTTPASCGGTACPDLFQSETCSPPPYCYPQSNVVAQIVGSNIEVTWDTNDVAVDNVSVVVNDGTNDIIVTDVPGSPLVFPWTCGITYTGTLSTNCSNGLTSSTSTFTITTPDCPPAAPCDGSTINFITGNYGSPDISMSKINPSNTQLASPAVVLQGVISQYSVGTNYPQVWCAEMGPNGWLLGGSFSSAYDGITHSQLNGFVKLKCASTSPVYNAQIDASYLEDLNVVASWGFTNSNIIPAVVRVMRYHADTGRLYVGGLFTKYKGVSCPRNFVALKASTGDIIPYSEFSLVNAGLAGTSTDKNGVYDIQIDSTGRIVVVGEIKTAYTPTGSQAISNIARYYPNGTLDTSLNVGTGFGNYISTTPGADVSGIKSIVIDMNTDDIYAVGAFYQYQGVTAKGIVKIKENGSKAPLSEFNPGTGFNIGWRKQFLSFGYSNGNDAVPEKIVFHMGKLLIAGNFSSYNGTTVNALTRIELTGLIDGGFIKDTTTYVPVSTTTTSYMSAADIHVMNDNKIILVGYLRNYLGAGCGYYVLNSNGSLNYAGNISPSNGTEFVFRIAAYNL